MDKKFIIILLMIIMVGSLWGTTNGRVFEKVDPPVTSLEDGIYLIVAEYSNEYFLMIGDHEGTLQNAFVKSIKVPIANVNTIEGTITLEDVVIDVSTGSVTGSDAHAVWEIVQRNQYGGSSDPGYSIYNPNSNNRLRGTGANQSGIFLVDTTTYTGADRWIPTVESNNQALRNNNDSHTRSIRFNHVDEMFRHQPAGQPSYVPISLYKLVEEDPDDPLNVTLSSFSASLIANNAVNLSWTTSSESNLAGFEIMRSENSNISNAQRIPHNSINGTNTSQHQSYRFIDYDVVIGMEYFYWLRMIMNDNSITYSEPVDVKVFEAITTPPSPLFTAVQSVYPNPLRTGTSSTFELAVKDNETAVLRIFNIRGQLVREFEPRKTGNHKINWNMRGSDNRVVGTGVYFYQLTSESVETVHRMVIIK